MAQLSGADFARLLQDELARIQAFTQPQTTQPVASGSNQGSHYASPTYSHGATTPELQASPVEAGAAVSSPPKIPIQYLPSEHLSTPETQKVGLSMSSGAVISPTTIKATPDSDPFQGKSLVPVQSQIMTRGAATLSFSLQTPPCLLPTQPGKWLRVSSRRQPPL